MNPSTGNNDKTWKNFKNNEMIWKHWKKTKQQQKSHWKTKKKQKLEESLFFEVSKAVEKNCESVAF